jgi:hypothetical protein
MIRIGRPALFVAQRLAMYIVISKPKRRSVNCGVVQVMNGLLKKGQWDERRTRSAVDTTLAVFMPP